MTNGEGDLRFWVFLSLESDERDVYIGLTDLVMDLYSRGSFTNHCLIYLLLNVY